MCFCLKSCPLSLEFPSLSQCLQSTVPALPSLAERVQLLWSPLPGFQHSASSLGNSSGPHPLPRNLHPLLQSRAWIPLVPSLSALSGTDDPAQLGLGGWSLPQDVLMGWECEVCPLEVGIWPLLGWKEQQSLCQVGIRFHQRACAGGGRSAAGRGCLLRRIPKPDRGWGTVMGLRPVPQLSRKGVQCCNVWSRWQRSSSPQDEVT